MYVVRFVAPDGVHDLQTVRDFAYGLMMASVGVMQRNDDKGVCFDLLPPAALRGKDESRNWAEYAARHFGGKGFNAVSAPAWIE